MWNEKFTKITKDETSLCIKFGAKTSLVPYSTSLLCVCEGDSVNFLLQVFFFLCASIFSTQNFPFFMQAQRHHSMEMCKEG
jgi:hypothetical protein